MQVSCYRNIRNAPYGEGSRHADVGLNASDAEGISHNGLARLYRANPVESEASHHAALCTMEIAEHSSYRKSISFVGGEIHPASMRASESRRAGHGIQTRIKNKTEGTEPQLRYTQGDYGIISFELTFSGNLNRHSRFKARATERAMYTLCRPEKFALSPANPNPDNLS